MDCDSTLAYLHGYAGADEVMGLKIDALIPAYNIPTNGTELSKVCCMLRPGRCGESHGIFVQVLESHGIFVQVLESQGILCWQICMQQIYLPFRIVQNVLRRWRNLIILLIDFTV